MGRGVRAVAVQRCGPQSRRSAARTGGAIGELDLEVGSRLPEGPVGTDVAGGAEQAGEVGVEQLLGGGLGSMDGDVHRGADGTGCGADRYGDRTHTGCELLVGEGPAASPNLDELLVEGLGGRADVAGETGAGRNGESRGELGWRQCGKEDLAL